MHIRTLLSTLWALGLQCRQSLKWHTTFSWRGILFLSELVRTAEEAPWKHFLPFFKRKGGRWFLESEWNSQNCLPNSEYEETVRGYRHNAADNDGMKNKIPELGMKAKPWTCSFPKQWEASRGSDEMMKKFQELVRKCSLTEEYDQNF